MQQPIGKEENSCCKRNSYVRAQGKGNQDKPKAQELGGGCCCSGKDEERPKPVPVKQDKWGLRIGIGIQVSWDWSPREQEQQEEHQVRQKSETDRIMPNPEDCICNGAGNTDINRNANKTAGRNQSNNTNGSSKGRNKSNRNANRSNTAAGGADDPERSERLEKALFTLGTIICVTGLYAYIVYSISSQPACDASTYAYA